MKIKLTLSRKGITLIELLVTLVIASITIAGVYRVFISQTRTYTIQDQVAEVQQNTRSAMEILLRDLRMTGFDDDNPNSAETIGTPVPIVQTNSVTVNYEYYDKTLAQYQSHQVAYSVDGSSNLVRTVTPTAGGLVVNPPGVTSEIILPNVTGLTFTYGVDSNDDKAMDDWNGNGVIDAADFLPAASVGTMRVVAIRVVLTARPDQTNLDVQKIVSPRTLDSVVTLRNLCLK